MEWRLVRAGASHKNIGPFFSLFHKVLKYGAWISGIRHQQKSLWLSRAAIWLRIVLSERSEQEAPVLSFFLKKVILCVIKLCFLKNSEIHLPSAGFGKSETISGGHFSPNTSRSLPCLTQASPRPLLLQRYLFLHLLCYQKVILVTSTEIWRRSRNWWGLTLLFVIWRF